MAISKKGKKRAKAQLLIISPCAAVYQSLMETDQPLTQAAVVQENLFRFYPFWARWKL
jgi:hypothetical protein